MYKYLLSICKRLDWNIYENKNDIELEKYSPAGEDFFFAVDKQNFLTEVINYAESFDPDEDAEMWVENMHNVNGVPQSIRALINDADDIKEMLLELAEKLSKGAEKYERIRRKRSVIRN